MFSSPRLTVFLSSSPSTSSSSRPRKKSAHAPLLLLHNRIKSLSPKKNERRSVFVSAQRRVAPKGPGPSDDDDDDDNNDDEENGDDANPCLC